MVQMVERFFLKFEKIYTNQLLASCSSKLIQHFRAIPRNTLVAHFKPCQLLSHIYLNKSKLIEICFMLPYLFFSLCLKSRFIFLQLLLLLHTPTMTAQFKQRKHVSNGAYLFSAFKSFSLVFEFNCLLFVDMCDF